MKIDIEFYSIMILFESLTSLLLTFLIMTVVCLVVEAILCISLYSYHWFLGDFSFLEEDEDDEFVSQKRFDTKPPIFVLEERTFSSSNRSYQTECCPICLTDYETNSVVLATECRHIYHKECLQHWLQSSKSTCPCCRQQLVHSSYTNKKSLGIYSINDDVSISSLTTPLTMEEARPSTYSPSLQFINYFFPVWFPIQT